MVRSSLGRSVLLDSGGLAEEYPFCAISVPDFLEMTEWQPHQDLKASGKVKEMGDKAEVLFCSHQWVSFTHPDPNGDQLRALQTQIRNLMKGKTKVTSNIALDAAYSYPMLTTGKEWKQRLPNMYIWLDYLSIPQPGAGAGTEHSDHRQSADNSELVSQLKAAVNSIPSYIARSSMMWIVVPPVNHASLDGAICDFTSWRRRGWCRMEFAASKLCAGDDMPLMVVDSPTAPPEYFNPCDIFKLCAAKGDFTVDSDRDAVNETLTKMLKAKVEAYGKEDITVARLLQVFSPLFVPREAYYGASGGLDHLKSFLKWRSDAEEAAWEAETGWNLLTLACAMDDAAAVDTLLAQDPATVKTLLEAKGENLVIPGTSKKGTRLRREPLGQKLLQYAVDMTPLLAAMTFASRDVVAKLLDAGAPVDRCKYGKKGHVESSYDHCDGVALLGYRPCTFRGAVIAGRHENVDLFLERYPKYANALQPEVGGCPLHYAALTSQCRGQKKVVEALLKHGAAESLTSCNGFWWGSVLATSCNTYDQDHDAVRLLMKAGADPAKPEVLHPQANFLRKVTAVFKFFGVLEMAAFNKMLTALPQRWKQTPTHIAAKRGDVALVKVLAEHEKFAVATKTTDTKGRTPLAVVVGAAPKAAIADIVGPAAVATPVPGNKVAPEQ